MRDLLPEEMIARNFIIDRIKEVFELYGFMPLETPILESWDVLSAKGAGGPEVLEETYKFKDKGGRYVGLRYDLTVPLARVVASNPTLPLPFKRYHISRVWRYGDVAKGRLREFWQADVDTVGVKSVLADAEIIACAIDVFKKLGFKEFTIRINHRKILSALIKYSGVKENKIFEAYRAIDRMDKVGLEGVKKELRNRGISSEASEKLLSLIGLEGEAEEVLRDAEELIHDYPEGIEGINGLREIIGYLEAMNIEPRFRVDLSLARGLDYYTGPIFEASAAKGIGSLAGGGRYDQLIGLLSGRDVPATGISLGIERIVEVMKSFNMINVEKSKLKVFVAVTSKDLIKDALRFSQRLRGENIPTEIDLKGRSLSKQLEYADSKGVKIVAIIGKRELDKGAIKLRDMVKRKEQEVPIEEAIKEIKDKLSND